MRTLCLFSVCLFLAPSLLGQAAGFELSAPGPMPPTGDPEGWLNGGGTITVVPFGPIAGPTSGAPTEGAQWCIVNAAGATGGLSVPAGGPAPFPFNPGDTGNLMIQFPVPTPPPGASLSLDFDWNFVTPECASDPTFNDFLSVDITDGTGNVAQNLLYRDTFSTTYGAPAVTPDETGTVPAGFCTSPGTFEENPLGTMKSLSYTVPAGMYGSVIFFEVNVGNGGDAAFSSYAYIDNVHFVGVPVPPTITMSQPGGPGTIQIDDSGLVMGFETWNVFSFTPCSTGPGTGPYGGLCANTPSEVQFLVGQVTSPLHPLNLFHFPAPGSAAVWGPYPGIPSGLTIEAVCLHLDPASGLVFGPVDSLTTQ